MWRHVSLWFALSLLSACGPDPAAPVKVMAIIPDETGTYGTREVQLTTVENVTTLQGSVLKLIGGNRVVVDGNDPTQQINGGIQNLTDEQRYEVLVRLKGGDVRGHYVDRSGTLWPDDFHTWNMVTTFYNFERAYDYYNFIYDGVDPKELRDQRVMYWAEVNLNSTEPIVDNALYLSFIKSFVVTPFKNDQLVPLAMNLGVIGHEMAHRVFNYKAYSDLGLHPVLSTWNLESFNWLRSMDEGLADFHGYSATCGTAESPQLAGCRPNFLADSISDARTVGFRNVGRTDACMDTPTLTALRNTSKAEWIASPNLYKVGNLLAASLYQAGNKTGKLEILQKALIVSLDDESATTPGIRQLINANANDAALATRNFTPEAVVDIIASHITDPELLKVWCSEASTRLQLRCGTWPCTIDDIPAMPHCPSSARRDSTICPLIQQP